MLRGKVTNVTSAGVYVQTADFGTVGPCQAVVANYAVGDMVLLSNVGDDSAPDLVVVGKLTVSTTVDIPRNVVQTNGGSIYHRILGTNASLYLDALASGQWSQVMYRTGASNRWTIYKEEVAESGSNAGSDLVIGRYADNGSTYNEAFRIVRATGKVRVGAAGTSAGIELGSSGPTITTGTGAPSHSAPNGSVYLRTDGTATTTLYVRASGAWSALS